MILNHIIYAHNVNDHDSDQKRLISRLALVKQFINMEGCRTEFRQDDKGKFLGEILVA